MERTSTPEPVPGTTAATSSSHVDPEKTTTNSDQTTLAASPTNPNASEAHLYEPYENGYHFPPKYSAKDQWRHGAVGFWKYVTTPVGFLVTFYMANVIAWGGMLFLLLCNASPAMCTPSCEDIDSPRRIWIEWSAQAVNGLFVIAALGPAPWRIRDIWYLMKFRIAKDHMGLRRLAGIHHSWFRLAGSQNLAPDVGPTNIPEGVSSDAIPYPENKLSKPPLTGVRAQPTRMWKLDFILWMNMTNSFVQCALCGIMWGMTRYTRPSWATGFLVAIGAIVGAVGGLGMTYEGKAVKAVEGVPLTAEDTEKLVSDKAQGILHYNNIKAKRPKEKGADPEKGTGRRRKLFGKKDET